MEGTIALPPGRGLPPVDLIVGRDRVGGVPSGQPDQLGDVGHVVCPRHSGARRTRATSSRATSSSGGHSSETRPLAEHHHPGAVSYTV